MFSSCFKNAKNQKLIVRTLENICATGYLGCGTFVICIGVIGAIFTLTDVFRVIQGGRTLADDMWRRRYARSGIVSHHFERDLKLISSVLYSEHYTFLIFGVFYASPTFFIPWLVLQGVVLFLEVMVFFARLICGGVHLFKGEVIINAILFHNWLQVLCYYVGLITPKV